MRHSLSALLILTIVALQIAPALCADYTPRSLTATIYSDGSVGIVYRVEADPTLVRVTTPLFGSTFTDLIVVNQDGSPLVTSQSSSSVTVDALGATELTFTYSTPELTSKEGILWTFNLTSPTSLTMLLPSGATVISVSQIPLDVKTVNTRTQITLPSGENSVSYIVKTAGTAEHAQTIIDDAETTINEVKNKDVITTEADSLLTQAKSALTAGDYVEAESLASDAKASALDADLQAEAAEAAIQRATTAIQTAKNEGRTTTITAAEEYLAEAETYFTDGDYVKAQTNAGQAYDSAVTSKTATDNTLLIAGGVLLLIAAVAGIFLYTKRQNKPPAPQPTEKKETEGPVNLELVFQKHADLRVDDKEVIRFLSERGGEAFANEIRDRFDIPRTSAWRMIRRLMDAGVVEEKKIGGQSLISVVNKYREAKKA